MSFVNPNFRNTQKKQIVNEENNVEMIDVNFNNVTLKGEPRRHDIPSKEENIISLDEIMKEEKKEEVSKFELTDAPSVANLTSVPRIEELSASDVAKIQINYLSRIEKTMSM